MPRPAAAAVNLLGMQNPRLHPGIQSSVLEKALRSSSGLGISARGRLRSRATCEDLATQRGPWSAAWAWPPGGLLGMQAPRPPEPTKWSPPADKTPRDWNTQQSRGSPTLRRVLESSPECGGNSPASRMSQETRRGASLIGHPSPSSSSHTDVVPRSVGLGKADASAQAAETKHSRDWGSHSRNQFSHSAGE